MSITHLARRLLRQPLVSASVVLGITLAVALGVAAPLATDALAALGLRATIEALPPASQNIQLTRPTIPFLPPLRQHIREQLGDLLADDYTVSYLPLQNARRAAPLLETPARLRTQSGLIEHSVIMGRPPQPASARGPQAVPPGCDASAASITAPIEVLLSAEQLRTTSLAVGDSLCIAGRLPAMIAGSFTPKNLRDPYWFDDQRPLRGESVQGEPVAVLMLTQDDFDTVWLRLFNSATPTHIYRGFVRGSAITLDTLDAIAGRLDLFEADLEAMRPSPALQSGLGAAIATFKTRLLLLQPALYALLLMLLVLAMIYVALVGTLVTQRQSSEIALLRSRGASGRQVFLAQMGQALVLATPGFALGLGLGTLGVLLLSRTALFQNLRGEAAFQLRFAPATWLLPGVVLLVAWLGLALATRPALAQSQVTLRQARARPPRQSGWRRAQLDALLALFAMWGVWQIRRYGGDLTTTLDGVARLNLLTLATPLIVLLAGALLLLRLFPLAVRGLGFMLGRRRGLVTALGAWQLARDPLLYARLVLLLILTIGLGVYSQTVTGTIARAQARQALDAAGADVRISLGPDDDPAALLGAIPTAAHTLVSRVDAHIQGQQQGTVALLGVDGSALSNVLARSGGDDAALLGQLKRIGTETPAPGAPAMLPVYLTQAAKGVQAGPGQRLELQIGEQRLDVVVQQRIGRLPGIDDDQQTVLLADGARLATFLTNGKSTTLRPTELRVALRPGATAPADLVATTKAAALRLQTADPLSNGVSVILSLGFGCALALSLVGFLLYGALAIQSRQIDWAVLGTLGFSRSQLLAAIAAEQGVVLAVSLAGGVALGLLLSITTRGFLQIVARNIANIPVVIDWQGLLLMVSGLLLALALALILLLVSVQRRGITRVLRLGEG